MNLDMEDYRNECRVYYWIILDKILHFSTNPKISYHFIKYFKSTLYTELKALLTIVKVFRSLRNEAEE